MSFIDGTIGNKRNHRLEIRLTKDEQNRLENMAASYNMEKSELVRERLFGRAVDYIKSEITGAVNKVKNGYQKANNRVKEYFSQPDDIYLPAYAPADYGFNPAYK